MRMPAFNWTYVNYCEVWIKAKEAPCRTNGRPRLLLAIVINRFIIIIINLWDLIMENNLTLFSSGGGPNHRCKKGWNAGTMFQEIIWAGRNI